MDALDVLNKIESAGYEAYIVGGYVRDKLLGYNSSDIDITTSAPPKEVAKIFELNQEDEFGCVNIKNSKYNIDITTFRREDNYFGHRPKKISYVKDLLTDLKRRDFTINAICMNSAGDIIDPLNGKQDLDNKLIKVIGNVKKKFSEDPLRILRAIRLSIIYNLTIRDDELVFIINNKKLLKNVSYTRKKEEIGKIFTSNNCIKGLFFLKTLGILDELDININDNIVYVKDYIGMWTQIDYSDKYPFSKLENQRIKAIKTIVKYGKVDSEILFKFGLYDSLVAGEILGLDAKKIKKTYDNMAIHSSDEVKVTGMRIKELLNITGDSPIIKIIKRDLIINLVSGNLTNEQNVLEEYIIKKWK